MIAANRSQFMALAADNLFGQNTAAIFETEARYAEMWVQDVLAMHGYANTGAQATALTPFSALSAKLARAIAPVAGPSGGTALSAKLSERVSALPTLRSELQHIPEAARLTAGEATETLAGLPTAVATSGVTGAPAKLSALVSALPTTLATVRSELQQVPAAVHLATSEVNGTLGAITGVDHTGLKNVPANLFFDIVNIPYNEFLAFEENAYSLGPPGTTGGVPGWLPPFLPSQYQSNRLYTQGGTGSWWMESTGNTWFWNNGNWPQLDSVVSYLIPFPAFSQPFAQQLQILAEAELPANDSVAQFEIPSLPGLLHGFFKVPLSELLSGYTFPASGPTVTADGQPVVWAGTTVQLQPRLPFQSFAQSLTATPTGIETVPGDEVLSTFVRYVEDCNDFNPFATGSFVYWGAASLYDVPNLLGGIYAHSMHTTNPFMLGVDPSGAEPSWGPTAGPSSVIPGLQEGFGNLRTELHALMGNK
jgi:hypothetical protein